MINGAGMALRIAGSRVVDVTTIKAEPIYLRHRNLVYGQRHRGQFGIPRTEYTDSHRRSVSRSSCSEVPANRYTQDEAIGALTDFAGPEFRRFALSSGDAFRNTALPLSRYCELTGFTEANDAYVEIALGLAEQAFLAALDEAKVKPSEVDTVFCLVTHLITRETGCATTATCPRCRYWMCFGPTSPIRHRQVLLG
jgi:hypothetical protein